jgi:hypothetical protein
MEKMSSLSKNNCQVSLASFSESNSTSSGEEIFSKSSSSGSEEEELYEQWDVGSLTKKI